jgi:hypothetical protein
MDGFLALSFEYKTLKILFFYLGVRKGRCWLLFIGEQEGKEQGTHRPSSFTKLLNTRTRVRSPHPQGLSMEADTIICTLQHNHRWTMSLHPEDPEHHHYRYSVIISLRGCETIRPESISVPLGR